MFASFCTLCLLLTHFSPFLTSVSAEQCTTEGDVRLADGVTSNEGRVEVCVDGQWGTVCDHNWGSADARVVCSQLGLAVEHSDAFYRYGGGSGPIHYAGFHCTGEETRLVDCTVDQQALFAEITNCQHFEDAGVHCTNVSCIENDVRLNEEVVQICHDQEWGLICVDTVSAWDDNAADVMCNQAGIPSQRPRSVSRRLIFYDAPVILDSVICSGTEDSINECILSDYHTITDCTRIAVTQCEVLEPCTSTDTIRLTQFSSDRIGRLEVCSGNKWGTVCGNDGATISTIATVACRELNHAAKGGSYYVEGDFDFALSLVPITRTNMVCSGFENALSECSFNGADGNSLCDHSDDIILICIPRECNETDVRLVSGQTLDDGRVEICLDGIWGSVCDDRWDIRDAEVVCRQLQYNGPSYPLSSHDSYDIPPPIHLDNVQCDGTESMLSECTHQGIGVHNCFEGVSEAGVVCTGLTCEDGTVHLVGGNDVSRGRVEYCYEGTWYTVCASEWENNGEEARVICRTLGYSFDAIVTNYGRGTSPILPMSIHCGIDDTTLSDCTTHDLNVTDCPHVAGINCGAFCLTVGLTDCDECDSRSECTVVNSDDVPICGCYSDCYEYGDCCTDVSQVQNCIVEECEDGEVRLVGGVTNSTGRLEVCGNGLWGRVCNRFQYWGPENARVVCRQLGFSDNGAYVIDDADVFGTSDRNPLVGEIHCVGTEPELFECSHTSIGIHSCGRDADPVPDVAISCYDEVTSCNDGDVRLQDGVSPTNGRVEICQYRTWGSVCSEGWDDNDAKVVCGQLGYSNPEDARAVEGFIMGENTPLFLGQVDCLGSETQLIECMNTTTKSDCSSAGVTCEKSSNTKRCSDEIGTPPEPLNVVTDNLSFGKCEIYASSTDVCDGVLRVGVDFVYISNRIDGTQNNISQVLNEKIKNLKDIIATHDKDCVDLVFTVICHYYLPPCGNYTHYITPSSLCQEECMYVQKSCHTTWLAAKLALIDPPFINCDDTSHLIFPLPNCCTGAGIKLPSHTLSTSEVIIVESVSPNSNISSDTQSKNDGIKTGAVVGIVIGISILAVVVGLITVLLVIMFTKENKRKRMAMVQHDIMANPVIHDTPTVVANAVYELPHINTIPLEPDDKNTPLEASTATTTPNPYCVPISATNVSASSLAVYDNRSRVPSQYFRDLTRGKFVVKYEDITLMETIGEGEFGIVYKGKIGSRGRSSREVAVKTLKGDFDQIEVDQFVEESWKMSRFKHSHVMGLVGVCLDTGTAPFIIMPYMANGSLLKHLKRERKNVVLSDENDEDEVKEIRKRLMVMCSQIASGMEYLASEKYIHRDLAARNCMIDKHFLIKITDFGLSEDVFVRNYYRQGNAGDVIKLPVKWMAPESLSDGHFSEKSDVWSYGVTMWEIFSGGKAPYPGTDPLTLMQYLETGQRMSKPYNTACTDEIYLIMRKCWEKIPRDRPTFKELSTNISKYTERIAGYLEMGFNPFIGNYMKSKDVVGKKEEREAKSEFQFQVIPPSDGAHSVFTKATD